MISTHFVILAWGYRYCRVFGPASLLFPRGSDLALLRDSFINHWAITFTCLSSCQSSGRTGQSFSSLQTSFSSSQGLLCGPSLPSSFLGFAHLIHGRFIGLFLHLIPTKKLDVKWLRIGSGLCLYW